MRIGQQIFTPSPFSIVLTVITMAVFMALSVWQLQRADYRNKVSASIALQNTQAPLVLTGQDIHWPEPRYRAVSLTGKYEVGDEILIDNVIHQGKPGYYVMAPLKLEGSETRILINRGWISTGRDRRQLPAITTPKGTTTIKGRLDNPRPKPVMIGIASQADIEGTKRWAYMDRDYLAKKVGYAIAPYIVLQESAKADGLMRNWPVHENKAAMHIGYSIQWAAFALITFGGFIAINLRKPANKDV